MNDHADIPDPDRFLEEFGFVRSLALSLVRDPHLADDLTQQTYLVALEGASRPRGALRAWLTGIVRNLARMSWRTTERRVRRERTAARPEGLPSPVENAARLEAQERLVRAVRDLPEPNRSTIVLRYLEDMDLPAIAERMDISVRAVESRLRRAKAHLRERLTEEYGSRKAWLVPMFAIAGLEVPAAAPVVAARVGGISLLTAKTAIVAGAVVLTVAAILFSVHAATTVTPPAEEAPRASSDAPPPVPAGASGDVEADQPGESAPGARVAAPANLAGVLLDAGGVPCAGAAVIVRGAGPGEERSLRRFARTDGQGRFEIGSLPTVGVRVSHYPEGARSVTRTVALRPGANEVRLEIPAGESLVVTVVDAQGRTIEGASVAVYELPGTQVSEKTAADGTVRFILTLGVREVRVAADEAVPLTLVARWKNAEEQEIRAALRGVEPGDEGLVLEP